MLYKCKQRITRIMQTLRRMRRLVLKTTPKLLAVHKKIDRREKRREEKAEQAARLEISIEKELLNRLKMGVYDGIANESSEAFAKAMETIEGEAGYEFEDEIMDEDEIEMEEDDDDLTREFVSDFSDDESDIEDKELGSTHNQSDSEASDTEIKVPIKKRRAHVVVEYEHEAEPESKILTNW